MEKLDTHYYDGKLTGVYDELIKNRLKILENNDHKTTLLSLNNKLNPVAYNVLTVLVQSIGTGGNNDPTNEINGDDLLLICSSLVDNEDFIGLFNNQLEEMIGGMCPQGRVDRLLQSVLPFL